MPYRELSASPPSRRTPPRARVHWRAATGAATAFLDDYLEICRPSKCQCAQQRCARDNGTLPICGLVDADGEDGGAEWASAHRRDVHLPLGASSNVLLIDIAQRLAIGPAVVDQEIFVSVDQWRRRE